MAERNKGNKERKEAIVIGSREGRKEVKEGGQVKKRTREV